MIALIKHINSKAQRNMPKDDWEQFRLTEAGKYYVLMKYMNKESFEEQNYVFPEARMTSGIQKEEETKQTKKGSSAKGK